MDEINLSGEKIEIRKSFYNIWRKYKNNEELIGEEEPVAELMALHKDWYHFWDSNSYREFDPDIDEFDPFLHLTFDTVIMNQINKREPEQARFTYNKLTARGDSHLEAIHKMALVFAEEFWRVMKHKKAFDEKKYASKLKALK